MLRTFVLVGRFRARVAVPLVEAIDFTTTGSDEVVTTVGSGLCVGRNAKPKDFRDGGGYFALAKACLE